MPVRVVTAAQAAARDAAAIAAGIPSRQLMQTAGSGAAEAIARRFAGKLAGVVAVFAGPGNNGGDAWIVAQRLAAGGATVRVHAVGESRTDDARAAREAALPHVSLGPPEGRERLVIDGLLGTGSRGAPSGAIAEGVEHIRRLREQGAAVVALDIPTGLDATTGAGERTVIADLTVTFGTMKRGHLVARGRCGAIVVVDIGLGAFAELEDGAPRLVDESWVAARVPTIAAETHKGARRRIAIVGGARGMAGATILAAHSAMRSGVGMVRVIVAEASLAPLQSTAVEATAATWPMSDADWRQAVAEYAHAVLVGPGLGTTAESRQVVEQVLSIWDGHVVIDADGLNVFAGDLPSLAGLLKARQALITPHAVELARLLDSSPEDVVAHRFDVGRDLARTLGAVVLLKGVPTVITSPDGDALVSAAGTPALAAAGSGDVLAGAATTLLAQTGDALTSAACAAWVHGRAAEVANDGRPVRGVTLHDVLRALSGVWHFAGSRPRPPELAELPLVGDRP